MNKNLVKSIVAVGIFSLALTHIFILFRFICNDMFEALLWGVAVVLLLSGLVFFIFPNNQINEQKRKKTIRLMGQIIFTSLGGILFTIDSFIFIDDNKISILLLLTITLSYLGIVILSYCGKIKD